MVLATPIFVKPWAVDDATAGMPAALVFGDFNLSACVSSGVRARAGFRILSPLPSLSSGSALLNACDEICPQQAQ